MEPKPIVELHTFRHPTDEQLRLVEFLDFLYFEQQQFAVCPL